MRRTIKVKLFSLCILLVLLTSTSISIPYYFLTKQDKKSESQIRIAVAFEIIRKDIEKRVQDKSQRLDELMQHVSSIPWELTWYGENDDKAKFFSNPTYSSYITTIGEEFVRFSNFVSASRLSLYTADKRLLVSYRQGENQEYVDAYVVNQDRQNTFLPIDKYSRLLIRGEALPESPLPDGIASYFNREIPNKMISEHFLDNGRLGLRIIYPVYNFHKQVGTDAEQVGVIVTETFYAQSMAEEYAKLSQAEVNFFADQHLFIGTLPAQATLELNASEIIASLDKTNQNSENATISDISLDQHDYYQGVRLLTDAQGNAVGSIAVSLSQKFEQAKIRLMIKTMLVIILLSIIFVFALTLVLSRKTLNSIKDLTTSTSEIVDGNLDYPINIGGSDELGILARSFATMREAIKFRIVELQNEITKHEQTNIELFESETRYRTLFEKSADAIFIIEDGEFVDCNQATLDLLGYASKDDLIGIHPSALSPEKQPDGRSSYEKLNEIMQLAFDRGSYRFDWECISKAGDVVPVETLFTAVKYGDDEFLHAVWRDITERKRASELLFYQASHDALTGLVNRREFERRAEKMLLSAQQQGVEHALCYMDLDQFKVVNDTCGHTAGDELLRQISNVLSNAVRHRDTLARLGGDEFGVLMEHCSIENAQRVAAALLKTIQNYQFMWEGHRFKVGVSMGLVSIDEGTYTLTELLKDVDTACYTAKDQGRNRIHIYHAEDSEIAKRQGEMQWVERIHHALEEDKFCLFAQAIAPSSGTDISHYELLIRMQGDDGQIIPPNGFLPAAERYDLISEIDLWVISKAFNSLKENPTFLNRINFCSINLSGQSLTQPDILEFITEQLETSGIPAKKICFEITETAAISNLKSATAFISTLKGLGCRFALDDFGSGLSSFAYLKSLPVDYLKIDGMFVKDIMDDPIDYAMVKSINEIGHVMGMKTIAEFVENDLIKAKLSGIGVNYVQGYGIGKPIPLTDLLD